SYNSIRRLLVDNKSRVRFSESPCATRFLPETERRPDQSSLDQKLHTLHALAFWPDKEPLPHCETSLPVDHNDSGCGPGLCPLSQKFHFLQFRIAQQSPFANGRWP